MPTTSGPSVMIDGTWRRKEAAGAERRACMACGAHALVIDPEPPRCRCCGSEDLQSVGAANLAQERRGRRADALRPYRGARFPSRAAHEL